MGNTIRIYEVLAIEIRNTPPCCTGAVGQGVLQPVQGSHYSYIKPFKHIISMVWSLNV